MGLCFLIGSIAVPCRLDSRAHLPLKGKASLFGETFFLSFEKPKRRRTAGKKQLPPRQVPCRKPPRVS
ncbi:hypothetical protein E2C01_004149 [Portunus trituberculatus]|uniref:Uncharacterized protein n=1 Tax=Portunus trituberculatus TaxID=210409 RepID=A0A5B7CP51_PORTR|nr:hypothetical protein [Portunus trituberculatus]